MSVDFDKFLNWAESRFHGDIVVAGDEIKVNSIFCEDYKHKLYCNPSGGKKSRPNGVFRCWKTDNRGSLVKLVMLVDKCSYQTALETLGTEDVSLANLQRKLEEFWDEKNKPKAKPIRANIALPPHCCLITELDENDAYRIQAEMHLAARCIPINGLYICHAKDEKKEYSEYDYSNRIIIPYYDRDRVLIYFNARHTGNIEPKYLGPPKELGVGKSDVLYVPYWPKEGSDIYLTEGEFDAKILSMSGLYSGAFGGKSMSEKQIVYLKGLNPILALDNDKAGLIALPKVASILSSNGFSSKFIRPPISYKDWNDMYIALGGHTIKTYIEQNAQTFNELSWKLNKL